VKRKIVVMESWAAEKREKVEIEMCLRLSTAD
jgi:hypothetical protein